ncbi:DM13 domain-containing protein [Litorisediminicola beolgyonensis]|uniref:DM13 domain-containing protein n=1 Tax=Litorisediminicola beolgyonensis TaxID=1173614 RepID=A0ABW3ZGZ1_9RHOB
MRLLFLAATHAAALAIGFAAGIYVLPILTAPASPEAAELAGQAEGARYTAEFSRDLPGSDFLHWGEGSVALSPERIVHMGRLAPGPDYKLYLSPGDVTDEASFEAVKDQSLQLGDVDSFEGFILPIGQGVDLDGFDSVVIWCEAFGEFITSARYR